MSNILDRGAPERQTLDDIQDQIDACMGKIAETESLPLPLEDAAHALKAHLCRIQERAQVDGLLFNFRSPRGGADLTPDLAVLVLKVVGVDAVIKAAKPIWAKDTREALSHRDRLQRIEQLKAQCDALEIAEEQEVQRLEALADHYVMRRDEVRGEIMWKVWEAASPEA